MNKYQEYLMYNSESNCIFYVLNGKYISCYNGENITIKQDDDITITKYSLCIVNKAINCIYAIKDGQVQELKTSIDPLKKFSIEIDFNNRLEAIKIAFINKIADDLLIPIIYDEADKEKYYAKKEQERKNELLKKAGIKVSTGADLVNIYFQPCCDKYDHTEILLYIPNNEAQKGNTSNGQEVTGMSSWSLIKKCKVLGEDFYESLTGLAYGEYAFILKQFDKKENMLLETDYITFIIRKPMNPHHVSFIH